ncbi:MAG: ABC transporter substrate-binding protein, partial [Alphaproteobacteria bacterium]|nr:ABC transporter substrate-binding protein [Alphaproteobacteria bacterium]
MDSIRLTRRSALSSILGVAAAGGLSTPGHAQAGTTLRIALAAPSTTMDPHLQSNAPNNAVATHIFDSLVVNDHASRSVPGLAQSWRILDDTRWEFTLHDGIAFSDGTPLTWEDIAVSIERVTVLPSTASFRTYTRTVKAITSAGGNKLIVETKAPDPLLLNSLSRIRIISKRFKDAPSAEYNAGPAAIGSGPYRLREFSPGNHVILVRNDMHWGPKAPWAEVQLRVMSDDGARTAALLSGAVDLVEELPSQSAERVQADARFHVVRGVSSRIVYFGMDHAREMTPFASDLAGAPLPQNPFRDLRVRQAFAMAINRPAIVERVMDGNALAAAQYLPKGQPGTSERIAALPFDPARAQALLAEAGYPKGFRLTLHGPNDRIINDAKIVQTVAQMLKRIGI